MPPTTASKSKSRTKRTSKATAKSASKPRARSSSSRSKAATEVLSPTSITNYTTALKWLYSHVDYERMRIVPYNDRTFSLERVNKVLEVLENPHEQLKFVHVAGSKGKGSTCAMLANLLQACGYTVGLYSSPHLVDLRERITVNGEMPSYADMADLFKLVAKAEKKLSYQLSFFEILTVVALCYFAEQAVDIVVLETGLGGRLDATNVVMPLVTGVTQISLDHTNILGRTLPAIAREKAGIFKKGVPAITVEQDPDVATALNEVASEVETSLEFTGDQIEFSFRFEANRELGPHTRVCLTTATSRFEHLPVPLRGEHQAHNCALALAMLDKLKAHGFNIEDEQVVEGLAKTELPGRMEQVWQEPRVLVDGAHNAASIQALIRSLGAHIAYDSLVVIFGCGQDKDIDGMLQQLALGADKVIFTRAKGNPRAMEAEDLLSQFTEVSGKMCQTAGNLEDALRLASRAVSREDLIVVTGSFYLAGEAKKFFVDMQAKRRK